MSTSRILILNSLLLRLRCVWLQCDGILLKRGGMPITPVKFSACFVNKLLFGWVVDLDLKQQFAPFSLFVRESP